MLLIVGGTVTAIALTRGDDGEDRAGTDPTSASESEGESESEPEPAPPPTLETVTPSTSTSPDVPGPSESVPDPDDGAVAITGFWDGTYECVQGPTALELTIAPSGEPDGVDAVFTFEPTPDNPGGPSGSFLMKGTISDGALSLTGTAWIDEPRGYNLVDLQATVDDPAADRISGQVVAPGCSTFEITR